jgi:hypothetical protein
LEGVGAMKKKSVTIKNKLEAIDLKTPKRFMGFREWCETVWDPTQKRIAQGALLDSKKPYKLATADLGAGAENGAKEMEGR